MTFRSFRRGLGGGAVGLAVVLGAASGCVYLRLLEIKKQLRDFDANFRISGRSELVIEFLNPVLKSKDVQFLIGADPLFQTVQGEDVYHYEFTESRLPAPPELPGVSSGAFTVSGSTATTPPPLHRLSLDVVFQNKQLIKIIVPETFMLLFPRNVLVETLKQAANAEVLETKRLARARVILPTGVEAELPSLSKTLFLLGSPLEIDSEGDLQTFVYRYHIVKEKRPVPITARLSFDAQGLLHRVFVRWDQSSIEALFTRS